MNIMKIQPDPNCEYCHGTGEVWDTVDYGSTTASFLSLCSCIEEQIPEDFGGEIEIDYETQNV